MQSIAANPLFSIALTIGCYMIGSYINRKTKISILNPMLIATVLVILTLLVFDIPLQSYNNGGDIINMLLVPITALLALSIYRQRKKVIENFLPILIGTFIGSLTSVLMIILLCNLLGIETVVRVSLIPKSVTTPIAIAISSSLGGIQGITIFSLVMTGLFGNMMAPLFVRIFRIKDHTAQGVAIGTASHALGTVKALEMGEDIGAISGIALSFSGIITVLISLFL